MTTRMNRRLLVTGLAIAAIFSVVWLWAAAGDRVTTYNVLPEGEPLSVAGTTWRLGSLAVETMQESRFGEVERPPAGAVFVVATLEYDSTAVGADAKFYCRFTLTDAVDLAWETDSGFLPADEAASSYCEPGLQGSLVVRYTVPQRLLDRVVGVAGTFYLGDQSLLEQPAVLTGRLTR